jgi:hypothetical protein
MLCQLPILDPVPMARAGGEVSPGRWHYAVKFAGVGSLSEYARDDEFPFRDDGFDRHLAVRKLRLQPLDGCAYVPWTIDSAWFLVAERGECVLYVLISHDFATQIEILTVEEFLEVPVDEFLVRIRHVPSPSD